MFNLFKKKPEPTTTVWLDKQTIDEGQPTTFEEAVAFVANRIDADTVSSPYYHHSGGRSVRNNLGLWDKESPLYQHMLSRFGLCHADDTGALISSAAHALRNGLEYNPAEDVERFKRHWRNQGFDPATMEQIPGYVRPLTQVYTFSGLEGVEVQIQNPAN